LKFGCCGVIFRYFLSYKLEEVGQAVFSAFVGQWFLFGIQTAARKSLHYTSTPYRRQPLAGRLPVGRDRFTVWQMILPSTAGLSFKTVMNHLTARNGVNVASSSPEVELSLNMSMLASVAENSAAESKDFISEMRLHLSCDETDCCTEKSVEWLFADETAVIAPSPQASTCDVKCSADGNCMTSYIHSFSCLRDVLFIHCALCVICSLDMYHSHTVTVNVLMTFI